MKAPSYYDKDGSMDEFYLTWSFIWSLIMLKLSSPRATKFRLGIVDYGYDD